MLPYRRDLKMFSRELRRQATDAERALWYRLRRKQIAGVQFYRQRPIGPFIVDFYAPAVRLVVEVDGGQHFDHDAKGADAARSAYLRSLGLAVLRFDNRQVLQELDAVVTTICAFMSSLLGESTGEGKR